MKRMMAMVSAFGIAVVMWLQSSLPVNAVNPEPKIDAPAYVLMEERTGKIICEHNAEERRSPASITKIMTMILVFDALESGKITLEDEVMTSAYAKSMGGSQVFLEEGELQSVDTLLKCIAVASGNDASVALAEHIAGSEKAFVVRMNEKAAELGLKNTAFLDCTGLSDSPDHYTTAMDVAIMSRYLISHYPQVYNYTGIWMEDIVHKTSRGESTFTLSSTNKLLKQYPYTTGLKTGSTDRAKYCISATAKNGDLSLISVVMGAEDPSLRFAGAKELLHYGFTVARFYEDEAKLSVESLPVKGALKREVRVVPESSFLYLDTMGIDFAEIEKTEKYAEVLTAPVAAESVVGEICYTYEGKELGKVKILAAEEIVKAEYADFFLYLFRELFL